MLPAPNATMANANAPNATMNNAAANEARQLAIRRRATAVAYGAADRQRAQERRQSGPRGGVQKR